MTESVQIKVAKRISEISPAVEEAVVSALVDREKTRRTDALVKAIDKVAKLKIELHKLKPDVVTYFESGDVASEVYSKARLEEKDKAQKKVDKLTNAINKALEKGEFGDVYNLSSEDQGGSREAS